MRIELSDEEGAAVRDLLAGYLRDLSAEIADTDNPTFRRELRHRRDLLTRVQSALTQPEPPSRGR